MDMEPMEFANFAPAPKKGETIFVTLDKWVKRRWWQLWRPKFSEETRSWDEGVAHNGPPLE